MRAYRAYIFGIDGHRYLKAPQFASDHPDDATAVKAAEHLVCGHDVELWDCARLVARFDHKSGTSTVYDDLPLAALRKVPNESLAPPMERERERIGMPTRNMAW